jgi:hypothetical protein
VVSILERDQRRLLISTVPIPQRQHHKKTKKAPRPIRRGPWLAQFIFSPASFCPGQFVWAVEGARPPGSGLANLNAAIHQVIPRVNQPAPTSIELPFISAMVTGPRKSTTTKPTTYAIWIPVDTASGPLAEPMRRRGRRARPSRSGEILVTILFGPSSRQALRAALYVDKAKGPNPDNGLPPRRWDHVNRTPVFQWRPKRIIGTLVLVAASRPALSDAWRTRNGALAELRIAAPNVPSVIDPKDTV